MVEKELKKLSRRELLEILIMQSKRVEKLELQLAEANRKLEDRRIRLEKVGSIAEAALVLNNVFEAAQRAAEQYLENVEIVSKQSETTDLFAESAEAPVPEIIAEDLLKISTEEESDNQSSAKFDLSFDESGVAIYRKNSDRKTHRVD
ncbi:MAG: hypothetical protein IKY41_04145 [Clostridia bacterium]|nr:hypothetical protein [Clostridia bacterium]